MHEMKTRAPVTASRLSVGSSAPSLLNHDRPATPVAILARSRSACIVLSTRWFGSSGDRGIRGATVMATVVMMTRGWAGSDNYFLDVMRAMVFLWSREETHFDIFE